MSDWERALVEVAHAIAGEPALLLVDDVADNLGRRETKDFIELLWAISKERQLAVLMSVSDAHATLLSDRIVRLAGGRLEQAQSGRRPGRRRPAATCWSSPTTGWWGPAISRPGTPASRSARAARAGQALPGGRR